MRYLFFIAVFLFASNAFGQGNDEKPDVIIHTNYGDIGIKLFKDTPLHRENFLKLAREGVYDSTLFHRVIANFMIQGGDPLSKDPLRTHEAGNGGPGYTLPAEINQGRYHYRGALAAARQGDQVNPDRRSSGSQFYIVQGGPVNAAFLKQMENQIRNVISATLVKEWMKQPKNAWIQKVNWQELQKTNPDSVQKVNDRLQQEFVTDMGTRLEFSYTQEEIKLYESIGGAPNLDMQYTVFGEVLYGMDVVDQIAAVEKVANDRPKNDIRMWMEVVE